MIDHRFWCTGHALIISDVVRAEGCLIYDSSGRPYLNLELGVWATPLGHSHPAINKAMDDSHDGGYPGENL